ncbi:hypothetical protein V5799_020161 [Amblyomma americanum]|uniref:Amino acid transporter n=1 Tax=Amblyomma americanum TaxID=6943 RepID=A0AAQ4EUU5_AMBAM
MRKHCLAPHHVEADTLKVVEIDQPLRRVSGLGLLSSAVALGFVLAHNADDRNVLLNFFINLSNAIAAMGRLLSWFLPVGLASLTATRVLAVASTVRSAHSLSLLLTYSLNVVVAVLVHTFVVLPLIQWVMVQHWKRGLLRFFGQVQCIRPSPVPTAGAQQSFSASRAPDCKP